jgi:hypothetical protein
MALLSLNAEQITHAPRAKSAMPSFHSANISKPVFGLSSVEARRSPGPWFANAHFLPRPFRRAKLIFLKVAYGRLWKVAFITATLLSKFIHRMFAPPVNVADG